MRAACIVSARTSREPSNRVIRGGNFNNDATNLLPPNRNNNTPTNRNNNVGFRCAKTVVFLDARTPRIAPRFTDRASAAIHSPPCPSV
jgi:hypothetical protein